MEIISTSCPKFSAFNACPSPCGPKTCENLEENCNKKGCGPKQCVCKDGFVQTTKNIADGCISIDECLPGFLPTSTTTSEQDGSGESPGEPVSLPQESTKDSCPIFSTLKDCVPIVPINCYTINTVS